MREHLRMDGIKVFKEDDNFLNEVMADHKIKNKSEAWRLALKHYANNKAVSTQIEALTSKVAEQQETLENMYLILQSIRTHMKNGD